MAKRGIKEARKDKIINAALAVFAEKGFSDATMADISKKAGVSTPVLYEYFKTKEDLLFTIPEKYTEEPIRIMEYILPYLREPEAKIRAIVQGYMNLYEQNPLYASLVMLQLKTNRNFLNTRAYEDSRKIPQLMLQIIREGINNGRFKDDTNAFLIRAMLLGTIEHLCIRKLLLGEPKNLRQFVDPMIDAVLDGIRSHPQQLSIKLSFEQSQLAKELFHEVSEKMKTPSSKKKTNKTS
jgi:TetR/AcrR family fatty acid metabolism transcriptional regulator